MSNASLPQVTRAADGSPAVDFAAATMPDGLVVEVLEARRRRCRRRGSVDHGALHRMAVGRRQV